MWVSTESRRPIIGKQLMILISNVRNGPTSRIVLAIAPCISTPAKWPEEAQARIIASTDCGEIWR